MPGVPICVILGTRWYVCGIHFNTLLPFEGIFWDTLVDAGMSRYQDLSALLHTDLYLSVCPALKGCNLI